MMEKLLAMGVAAVVFGVTLAGATAAVAPVDAPSAGVTAIPDMQSNASYLAPMPINDTSMPLYQPPSLATLAITRT